MTRTKSLFAMLLLTAIAGVVPQAYAQSPTPKVVIAGSSAMWNSMAVGAYNAGNCVSGGVAPCFHYTAANFNLTDGRPTVKGGATAVDKGNIWIVWDSASTTNVWAYIKVDSAVGDRCYFAQPHCNINISSFPAPANLIGPTLWGDTSSDSTPPAAISALSHQWELSDQHGSHRHSSRRRVVCYLPRELSTRRRHGRPRWLGIRHQPFGHLPSFWGCLGSTGGYRYPQRLSRPARVQRTLWRLPSAEKIRSPAPQCQRQARSQSELLRSSSSLSVRARWRP